MTPISWQTEAKKLPGELICIVGFPMAFIILVALVCIHCGSLEFPTKDQYRQRVQIEIDECIQGPSEYYNICMELLDTRWFMRGVDVRGNHSSPRRVHTFLVGRKPAQ